VASEAILNWVSLSDGSAEASAFLDFSVSTNYAFDLAPAVTSFSTIPIVSRSFVMRITGLYKSITLKLDNATYIYEGKSLITLSELEPYSRVEIICTRLNNVDCSATLTFYNSLNLTADPSFAEQQNALQINAFTGYQLSSTYIRGGLIASSPPVTVISPGTNLNGIRVDSMFMSIGDTGLSSSLIARVCGKTSPPSSWIDGTAFTLGLITLPKMGNIDTGQSAILNQTTYPFILPSGFGIYLAVNNAMNELTVAFNYVLF
jgi:hypothetical protein